MWKTTQLDDVCSVISGNSISKQKKETQYKDVVGTPYVATKDVGFDGKIDYQNGVYIPDDHLEYFRMSPKEATLVCAEGGSAGRKIAYSSQPCCFGNKLFSIYPKNDKVEVYPKYVYYYVLGSEFGTQFREAIHGIIGGVSLRKIRKFSISFPELSEQQRTIKKLDIVFTSIRTTEDLIDLRKKEIEKLRLSILRQELEEKKNERS